MEIALVVGLALLAVAVVAGFALLFRRLTALSAPREDAAFALLQSQLADLRGEITRGVAEAQHRTGERVDALADRVDRKLAQTAESFDRKLAQTTEAVERKLGEGATLVQSSASETQQRLDGAARAMGEVERRLAELKETNSRLQDYARNLQDLQDILRAPKLRGVWGELYLGDLLAQVLPAEYFTLQHRFKNGDVVDAVAKLGDKLVPIDAKFPLENFRRLIGAPDAEQAKLRRIFLADVKRRVDEIAGKYIQPDEGTLDIALMYIPAENVYYETFVRAVDGDDAIVQYALGKRVIPVSPNTIYAYLQVLLLGIRGLQVEANAQAILSMLGRLKVDFERVREEFDKVGVHLGHAAKAHDQTGKRFERVARLLASQAHEADNGEE
ncbi:MAG: DNA recombination protein RmuC [Myxococcales bacterium]|nr:MAG: DNA recombination protein RmuC [Myxococcales bacterium]